MRSDIIDLTCIDSCSSDDDDLTRKKRPKLSSDGDGDGDNGYGDGFGAASELTSAYSALPISANTLMVLTEGRAAAASEIAYCFFDLSTTHCTLSQFADGPSYSHAIYAII
ncbi:hypothetical protein GGI00_004623, partial [Coemansia sp. RSA 2681]